MGASYAWNCDPGKFIFSSTLSRGTTFHIQFIHKNTLFNSKSNNIHTHNNNQNLTRSWIHPRCSVNKFSGSCCKRLAMSHAAPIRSRQMTVDLYRRTHCIMTKVSENLPSSFQNALAGIIGPILYMQLLNNECAYNLSLISTDLVFLFLFLNKLS
jgi:hypothetical protein